MIFHDFPAILRGVDLKSIWHFSEDIRRGADEQWQDAFRSAHGSSAMEHLHADCRAVWRGRARPDVVLRRALSGHGLRSTDLSRESARYRDVPLGAGIEALFHGLSRSRAPLDACRCPRGTGLADLRRDG